MTGLAVGLAFGVGLLLAISGLMSGRVPAPADRIDPYLRDVVNTGIQRRQPSNFWTRTLHWAASTVDRTVGGRMSVQRRFVRLGSATSVESFRQQQVFWGTAAFGLCALVSVLLFARGTSNAISLVVFCCLGFVGGVFARDQALSSAVRKHEARVAEEFPAVADLLALAVAAGEGPVAGLERVVRVSHGALAVELQTVLARIRTGTPLVRAFDDLAARTGVPSIARFAEGIAVAVERGTPLVDVLHAQAADVRESTRRELIESGGRKEVAMMIPVVFLILPVTVIFAFYPGFIALHMTSGF